MSNQKFEGAVTGKEGSYKDRTLLLENRCEVFFHIEGEQIYVDQSPEGAEAGIWYIEQREEYAVQPAKTSTVYLKKWTATWKEPHLLSAAWHGDMDCVTKEQLFVRIRWK